MCRQSPFDELATGELIQCDVASDLVPVGAKRAVHREHARQHGALRPGATIAPVQCTPPGKVAQAVFTYRVIAPERRLRAKQTEVVEGVHCWETGLCGSPI